MAPNGEQDTQGRYESQDYSGDQATDITRIYRKMEPDAQVTHAEVQGDLASSQADELRSDVRMGDDRAIGSPPNWDSYSSQQLYDSATQNNSPTTADGLGRAFNTGGNKLADAANRLLTAVGKLDGAWSGEAADSARNALSPLASAAGTAGTTAQLMGAQMSQQSVAASEVRNLPQPQEFNEDQALNAMVTGGPAAMQADLKDQKDAADAVKREQVSYLDAYTRSMTAVDNQTPSFVPPPPGSIDGSGGGGTPITGSNVGTLGTGYDHSTSTGRPSGGWTGAAPDASAGFGDPGSGEGGDDLGIPGTVPGSGTGTAGYTPGGSPPSTVSPTGIGGAPHTAAPSAGSGGFGAGFGNFGGQAGGSGGAGGSGNAGSGARGGLAPNTGSGGPAAKGVLPAGGMGGRPGGPGMGGGMPGGRRKGEDDEEHERPSYLVEGDPESTFGNDQMTAPAVIGDDDD